MKSWKKPTNELIDKALRSTKKVTARKYFFARLENPLWLQPLAERGYFRFPPESRLFDDGTVQFPHWPELQYLKNVARDVPNEVIDLVLRLPKVDNPVIYDGILDIALQLPGEHSAKLKPKILEYAGLEHQWRTHRYADMLANWVKNNQLSTALELSKILVMFSPDPQSEEKQKRRKEDPISWGTLLHPLPRIGPSEYTRIMADGVLPFAEKAPYEVACLLIDATADMIRLRTHPEEFDKEEDHSETWCNLLSKPDSEHERPEKTLVHTLTFACEKVFENLEKSPDAVVDLDRILRKQQRKIFKRLRHHLYAQYPNEQTKPWIQESILTHEDYGQWKHSYEFQQMIRRACEHFGGALLTKAERTRIFDTILDGPSKENYRYWVVGWLGEEFTEARFQERQQRFYRMQFTPFASVLFGKYKTRFQELKEATNDQISDEAYLPSKVSVGSVSKRSPRSPEDLEKFSDEKLLDFINEWEKEDEFSEGASFIEINIETLANVFQTVFRESIISDPTRFKFWMENREKIERPIYIRMITYAMQAHVKEKNFDQLNKWLTFCEWVLSHPDQAHDADYRSGDESKENSHWSDSRRAIGDFISVCLEKDVEVPITARGQFAKLLEMLCTQFDWRLDENRPRILNQYDPLTESVNNTRSRALEDLVKFGFWLRHHDSDTHASEVTTILKKRFTQETDYRLTLPEYAMLGKNYLSICSLNESWAIEHKSDFFPQNRLLEWVAAFSSFVLCNGAVKPIFKILENDFKFALQHLSDFKKRDRGGHEPIDVLGERLFNYYLLEVFPLEGPKSLLEQFYQQTDKKQEHWANLFNNIGHRLWNTGKHLNPSMKNRVKKFFDWRLKCEKPTELRYFTIWLQAECLETEWRLNAYSKVLDVCKVEDWGLHLKTLCEMLPNHTAKVVECFFKLTEQNKNDNSIYIQTEEAKAILKVGLDSSDERVQHKAEHALNNLLREGRFELLDMDDR